MIEWLILNLNTRPVQAHLCWDREEECAVKRLRWAVPGKLLAVESTDQVANPTIYLEPEDRAVYLIGRVIWSWREH